MTSKPQPASVHCCSAQAEIGCICGSAVEGRCHVAEPNWIEEIKWSLVGQHFLQRAARCRGVHMGC